MGGTSKRSGNIILRGSPPGDSRWRTEPPAEVRYTEKTVRNHMRRICVRAPRSREAPASQGSWIVIMCYSFCRLAGTGVARATTTKGTVGPSLWMPAPTGRRANGSGQRAGPEALRPCSRPRKWHKTAPDQLAKRSPGQKAPGVQPSSLRRETYKTSLRKPAPLETITHTSGKK